MPLLFPDVPLKQTRGELPERWGQGGSKIFNFGGVVQSDATQYTVTANKKLFIKDLIINDTTGVGAFTLRDGGAAGPIKFTWATTGGTDSLVTNFGSPLQFDTDVYADETTDGMIINLTLSGWEE